MISGPPQPWRPRSTLTALNSLFCTSPPYNSTPWRRDRKSTRQNSSHANISYAVFCLKKKDGKAHGYPPLSYRSPPRPRLLAEPALRLGPPPLPGHTLSAQPPLAAAYLLPRHRRDVRE